MDIKNTVKAVNDSPFKVYLAITGGGSRFVGDFLAYGGGSNTILGVTVPYSQACCDDFLGWVPNKYTSAQAAEGLALQSYILAHRYDKSEYGQMGIGVSASLTKGPDERKDRKNVAYVSVVEDNVVENYEFDLKPLGDREQQEKGLSEIILKVLAKRTVDSDIVIKETECYEQILGNNRVYLNNSGDNFGHVKFVFSGSFNPFHWGHRKIVDRIEKIINEKVFCEISIRNAYKGLILPSDLSQRIFQFDCQSDLQELAIVNAPLFKDKIKIYPKGTTFVIGADTFARILSFENDTFSDLYNWVYVYDAKFIVVQRDGQTWKDIVQKFVDNHGVEKWYGSHEQLGINPIMSIYQETVDKMDWNFSISSTQIRNGELINE